MDSKGNTDDLSLGDATDKRDALSQRRDISPAAQSILRGTMRFLGDRGFGALPEMSLDIGRRVDLMALSARSELVIIEVKSCLQDWRSDTKWQEYLPYCDRFFVAVDQGFPLALLEKDLEAAPTAGIIIADRHDAAIVREAQKTPLHASRRKALVNRFAYSAGRRFLSDVYSLPG